MTIYGRFEELVSRCVECDLAEPESLASLGGSAPGVVDGILSKHYRMKSIYARKQVELFLDEEERSVEDEKSFEESSIEEEEEPKPDGTTLPHKRS